MASVHRDPRFPKGVWYCSYLRADGQRSTSSTGKKDKKEAIIVCQALQQTENERAGGQLTRNRVVEIFNETLKRLGESPIERINVGAWLNDWVSAREPHVAYSTYHSYKWAVTRFLEYLGPQGELRRLESINEKDIEGFIKLLRSEGLAPKTINDTVRKQLNSPFLKAKALGKITVNPIALTQPEKPDTATRETFTPEEVVRLVKAARGTDWAGAILFAWTSGARLMDAVNLSRAGIDRENGVVTFRQRKTGETITVGLHPDFESWLKESGIPADRAALPVFPVLAGTGRNQSADVSGQFDAIMDKAAIVSPLIRQAKGTRGRSLRGKSFHSFRHSAASMVFNQAALKEITRRVTGHAGNMVTQYIHKDLVVIKAATSLIPPLPKLDQGTPE